jgi:long-chain acyl-CoA synthetase
LIHALSQPDKPAGIMAQTGEALTYAELDAASNQGAHLLRALGLRRGDVLAVLLDNSLEVFEIAWAAQRAGLYLTSVSTKLTAADVRYIVTDAGASVLIASSRFEALASEATRGLPVGVILAGDLPGGDSWRSRRARFPRTPIEDQSPGADMLYSSGTTGRPKGVKPPLPSGDLAAPTPLVAMGQSLYGMGTESIYLSTSPLYHAAPLRWALTIQRLGGTVVVMDAFDAAFALELIERFRITHSTWVPTHFVRLLQSPAAVRDRFDLSSMQAAIHAAAPCPVAIKQAMIAWWGPIIHEYYAGTEQCGITAIATEEWLRKPGSVGRAVLGEVKIVGDDGEEAPTGVEGLVYFAGGPRFEYHNDPEKTAKAHNARGWATLGDVGRLDEDGYLYLTDRKDFMIISGGVNIYPQEIENLLITHPKVADVAVIGAPDPEMGEQVVAVVQARSGVAPGPALADELRSFARERLGGVKTPRRFEFRDQLPREPTGKLMKASLRKEFWAEDQR